ncbi:nitrogen fixation protein FixH [Caenimonas koreensis]|uniref:nitrogen fixation protein FixH n=1 Tax=Caenimonas koreensis TaxID=367474 RepID=UPI0037852BFF
MDQDQPAAQPWWKFGHVWLVLSGPAIVVVAGFITLWIAVQSPDPVIGDGSSSQTAEIRRQLARERALMPALIGRNHAATPAREK